PSVHGRLLHPYLVTTGTINENALPRISAANVGWRKRRLHRLVPWQGRELLTRFVRCHGRFLPSTPTAFQSCVRLFVADGRDVLPKARLSNTLSRILDPAS